MKDNTLHGNKAKVTKQSKIEPLYQTNTVTSKQTSNVHSKAPVTYVLEDNVEFAKECVDENHK